MLQNNPSKISAERVRYIKLGKGGGWDEECFKKNIIRIGFGSARYFDLCSSSRWDELGKRFETEGRGKGKIKENTNQVRTFFEDDGNILWITFSERLLWWAFVDGSVLATPHNDGRGAFRPVREKWMSCDILGNLLHMDELSGNLTKLAAYRGTSCMVSDAEYVVRRINGERHPDVQEAEKLTQDIHAVIVRMLRLLTWQDFELLVDLVFSKSGWLRQGVVGKTEKTVDMEVLLPSTGERAFVQVKSSTNQKEFDEEYREPFSHMDNFDRMFYVYHSGSIVCDDPNIRVIGPDRFSEMVFDAGLTSWLIRRTS
jgi:hypothetical protein